MEVLRSDGPNQIDPKTGAPLDWTRVVGELGAAHGLTATCDPLGGIVLANTYEPGSHDEAVLFAVYASAADNFIPAEALLKSNSGI